MNGDAIRIGNLVITRPSREPRECRGLCEPGTCESCTTRRMDSARDLLWAEHGMDDDSIAAARRERGS